MEELALHGLGGLGLAKKARLTRERVFEGATKRVERTHQLPELVEGAKRVVRARGFVVDHRAKTFVHAHEIVGEVAPRQPRGERRERQRGRAGEPERDDELRLAGPGGAHAEERRQPEDAEPEADDEPHGREDQAGASRGHPAHA
ncbi:MAG: hypothetical protein R3B99_06950 [Polyangiales bacterium]